MGASIARDYGIEPDPLRIDRAAAAWAWNTASPRFRPGTAISRQLVPAKQTAFIKNCDGLPYQMLDDETVIFADAAHPSHSLRPVGCPINQGSCRAPKQQIVAVEQSSGRDRMNIALFFGRVL